VRSLRVPHSPRAQPLSCSLIPPAYYADLCAERGRLYLNEIMLAVNDDKSTATRESRDGERRRVADAAKLAWGRGVHDDIKETMYYI
jgi:eukaryotic translation initiation factor 2C